MQQFDIIADKNVYLINLSNIHIVVKMYAKLTFYATSIHLITKCKLRWIELQRIGRIKLLPKYNFVFLINRIKPSGYSPLVKSHAKMNHDFFCTERKFVD